MQFFDIYNINPGLRRIRVGRAFTVQAWEQAVVFRRGALAKTLRPGRHRVWTRDTSVQSIDTRPWILQVPTQEIPTADGTTVKVTVSAAVRVVDPVAYVVGSQAPNAVVYLAVQIALRTVVGATTVEDLLASRPDLGERLLAAVDADAAAGIGLAVDRLDIKDVILSAELKRAQAEVLVARVHGLAALERARGETAALRGLANAARAAADNPALLQLRLLQELGSTTGHTVVIGMPPLLAGPIGAGE